MLRKSYKKGGLYDLMLFVPVAIFLFAIMTIIGYYFYVEMYGAWQSTGYLTAVTTKLFEQFGDSILFFDWITVILVSVLIILATYRMHTRTEKPIVFLGCFVVAPFIGLISYILSYIFNEMISTSELFAVAQLFPKTVIFATNLYWLALITMVFGVIATFAKSLNNSGGDVQL